MEDWIVIPSSLYKMPKGKFKRNSGKRSNGSASSSKAIQKQDLTALQSLDTQSANMYNSRSDTLLWNVNNGYPPRFGRSNQFDNKIYNVIQMAGAQTAFTTNSATPAAYSTQVNAAYLNQFSSFAAIFDQYRIMEVEFWILPTNSTGLTSNSSGNLYTTIDYDDANVLTSVASALQYENVTVTPLQSTGVYRKFRPHQAVSAYQGTFAGFQNEKSQWNDCAYPNIQHFGLKTIADPTPSATQVTIVIESRLWVQFRNVT